MCLEEKKNSIYWEPVKGRQVGEVKKCVLKKKKKKKKEKKRKKKNCEWDGGGRFEDRLF